MSFRPLLWSAALGFGSVATLAKSYLFARVVALPPKPRLLLFRRIASSEERCDPSGWLHWPIACAAPGSARSGCGPARRQGPLQNSGSAAAADPGAGVASRFSIFQRSADTGPDFEKSRAALPARRVSYWVCGKEMTFHADVDLKTRSRFLPRLAPNDPSPTGSPKGFMTPKRHPWCQPPRSPGRWLKGPCQKNVNSSRAMKHPNAGPNADGPPPGTRLAGRYGAPKNVFSSFAIDLRTAMVGYERGRGQAFLA